jgi:hypothetical protein
MVSHARRNLEAASNKSAVVYEPAAALLLTCKRIGWEVLEATSLKIDLVEVLDLRLDPLHRSSKRVHCGGETVEMETNREGHAEARGCWDWSWSYH